MISGKRISIFLTAVIFLVVTLAAGVYSSLGAGAAPANTPRQHPERSQIRAFIYHHFGTEDKYPSTSVSVAQFRRHLAYFKKNHYTVLPLGAAMARIAADQAVPEKIAVITIDDGYASVWENALPLLEKYGYKATVFISTAHVGGDNYLSWDQIGRLQEKGYEIGNHSHSHAYFLNADPQNIAGKFEADLKKAHELFRRHLGEVPRLYAYPFGEYHPDMFAVLDRYGYQAAATQRSGVIWKGSQRFALPRFPMNMDYADMDSFAAKAGMNALGVVSAEPKSPLVSDRNPPVLRLRVENPRIDPAGLHCFVSGQKQCLLDYTRQQGALVVRARSRHPLASRRTLYTITAPADNGSDWFWYAHLWVQPDIRE